MPTCRHCSAKIPSGRTYCHPHYLEALRQHEQQVAAHQNALHRWGHLSTGARLTQDRKAEADELCLMASLVATFSGGYLWYQVNALLSIDGVWGLMIMVGTGLLLLGWNPARRLTGKLARAAFVALPPLIYGLLGLGMLCLISEAVRSHALPLFFTTIAVVLANSLLKEWTGRHHASGMPVQPVEPRP